MVALPDRREPRRGTGNCLGARICPGRTPRYSPRTYWARPGVKRASECSVRPPPESERPTGPTAALAVSCQQPPRHAPLTPTSWSLLCSPRGALGCGPTSDSSANCLGSGLNAGIRSAAWTIHQPRSRAHLSPAELYLHQRSPSTSPYASPLCPPSRPNLRAAGDSPRRCFRSCHSRHFPPFERTMEDARSGYGLR